MHEDWTGVLVEGKPKGERFCGGELGTRYRDVGVSETKFFTKFGFIELETIHFYLGSSVNDRCATERCKCSEFVFGWLTGEDESAVAFVVFEGVFDFDWGYFGVGDLEAGFLF